MRTGLRAALAALLLAAALPAFGGGAAEGKGACWESARDGQTVTVSGTLRRVGTGTFNDLVVTDADGKDWYVDRSSVSALAGLEQRSVKVEGVVKLRRMKLANGKELPARRELSAVRVVE